MNKETIIISNEFDEEIYNNLSSTNYKDLDCSPVYENHEEYSGLQIPEYLKDKVSNLETIKEYVLYNFWFFDHHNSSKELFKKFKEELIDQEFDLVIKTDLWFDRIYKSKWLSYIVKDNEYIFEDILKRKNKIYNLI